METEEALSTEFRKTLLTASALFLLNVILNAPLFLPGESPYRDSIEGGYASMARFLAEHPNPFGWNPLQYFGLPTHMWYLPGVPYAAALCIKLLPFLKPEHIYRLVVTTTACLVPATAFLFTIYFTRYRRYALMSALCFTWFSPAYYYFWQVNQDRGIAQVPWRIHVLLKYGEGPHNAGLALLPLALIAAWRAATRRSYVDIFLAAVLFAAIALTNWVAALSLAWCCLMMLLAGIGTAHETGFLARRLLLAAGFAYLLACFWLTPEFIRTVAFNWPKDAFGYKLEEAKIHRLIALFAVPVLIRLAFLKFPRRYYLCFLTLCLFGFSFIAYCHYWENLDPIPESRRYALEAELFLFPLVFEILRMIVQTGLQIRILAISVAVIILSMGFNQFILYPFKSYVHLRPSPRQQSIEYKVASALNDLHPRGRVLVLGGTRFRLNQWFLLPQVGGTFESGVQNRVPIDILYSIKSGIGVPNETRATATLWQLKVAGVEYVAIHGPGSREHWKDWAWHPLAFDKLLERVWQDEDDRIYRVPYYGYAHLVRQNEVAPYIPIGLGIPYLKPYVEAISDTGRPALSAQWQDPSRMTIDGAVPPEMLVSVQVSYDKGWRAARGGVPIPVEKDPLGFILLRPKPASSESRIELLYVGWREQKVLTAVSAFSWMLVLAGLWRSRRRARPK